MAISLQLSASFSANKGASALSSAAEATPAADAGLFAGLFASAIPVPSQIAAAEDAPPETALVTSSESIDSKEENTEVATCTPELSLFATMALPAPPVTQPAPVVAAGESADLDELATRVPVSAEHVKNPEQALRGSSQTPSALLAAQDSKSPTLAEDLPLADAATPDVRLPLMPANSADEAAEVTRWMSGLKPEALPTAAKTASSAENNLASMAPVVASSQTQTSQAVLAASAPQNLNRVAEPVGDSRWAEALGQRTLMMLNEQTRSAELELNPPHLGPLSVKLSLDGESASLSFVTAQPVVREALQQSVSRLQSVFAENGFLALDVNVQLGQHRHPQQEQSSQEGQAGFRRQAGADDEASVTALSTTNPAGVRRVGLRSAVDMFV